MKSLIIKSITVLLALSALAGCQGHTPFERESDPYVDYPGMNDGEAVRPPEADPQTIKVKSYSIDLDGAQSSLTLNFLAGEQSSFKIRGRSFVNNTIFTLAAKDAPAGMTFTPVAGEPGVWSLQWNPSLNLIPLNEDGYTQQMAIEFRLLEGTSVRARQAHKAFYKTVNLSLNVRHSKKQPVIVESAELSKKTEIKSTDGNFDISIVVKDPLAHSDARPDLDVVQERGMVLPLVPAQAPKKLNENTWKFYYTFKPSLLHNDADLQKSNSVNLKLGFKAYSNVTNERSVIRSWDLKVNMIKEAQ